MTPRRKDDGWTNIATPATIATGRNGARIPPGEPGTGRARRWRTSRIATVTDAAASRNGTTPTGRRIDRRTGRRPPAAVTTGIANAAIETLARTARQARRVRTAGAAPAAIHAVTNAFAKTCAID